MEVLDFVEKEGVFKKGWDALSASPKTLCGVCIS